ncbi:hypothetical protein J7T55_012616 [Diaporthe amygdali]|uniref:uncharacterized protein n=1 Tax=Phomopsis amygdali TaxID=1214568 RepID=UPI0022FE55A5|nr:uncharacterized protein J7T55_012616 [Diaporthe amygdali]KAJ0115338.1 hypothetical protein J7T55_012616 [Diaporthe amygdali]
MNLLCPENLDFGHGASQICDLDVLYPWSPEIHADPMAVVDPFIIKYPAPRETDWEAKKPFIEHFYLTENQTLNATIICMREQHGFNATEKMYKRHFRVWGWYKYTSKSVRKEKQFENETVSTLSLTGASEPPRKKARVQEEPDHPSPALSTTSTLIPMDLQNFQQKATIFAGINQLLDFHVRTTTLSSRACSSSKYRLLHGDSAPRLRDGFYEALNILDCKKTLGREAIERVLDQVQYHIKEDDITSFVELCFLIPRALLFSKHSRSLRSYLSRFIHTLREKNIQGPFAEVSRLLLDVYESQRQSGLSDLLVFASSVFAAGLVEKYGREDRNALLATWDSFRLAGQLDPSVASAWLGQWELSHKECMSRFGRHSLLTLGLEDDLSSLVQPTRVYPESSCPAEVTELVNSVRRKLFLIPGDDSDSSSFEDDNHLFF